MYSSPSYWYGFLMFVEEVEPCFLNFTHIVLGKDVYQTWQESCRTFGPEAAYGVGKWAPQR